MVERARGRRGRGEKERKEKERGGEVMKTGKVFMYLYSCIYLVIDPRGGRFVSSLLFSLSSAVPAALTSLRNTGTSKHKHETINTASPPAPRGSISPSIPQKSLRHNPISPSLRSHHIPTSLPSNNPLGITLHAL